MADYLFLLLVIAPLLASGAIVWTATHSLWLIPLVLLGAIAGAILIPLSGTFWLQVLHPSIFESQGGGIVFIAVILPFFAYSGCVAGACLVAMLSGLRGSYPILGIAFAVASLGTVILTGLLPVAIATIPLPSGSTANNTTQNDSFDVGVGLAIGAIGNGIISALSASSLVKMLHL
jgi:hypothetical protein